MDEFRALVNKDVNRNTMQTPDQCANETNIDNFDDEIFSIDEFEETEQISIH